MRPMRNEAIEAGDEAVARKRKLSSYRAVAAEAEVTVSGGVGAEVGRIVASHVLLIAGLRR